jgi:hypothetical protein
MRLEAIELEPEGPPRLADDRPIALDIIIAEIELEGEIVGGTIITGTTASRAIARRYRPRVWRLRGRPAQRDVEAVAGGC